MSGLAKVTDLKQFFSQDAIKNKFQEMLGKRAPQFITSVLQIASNNSYLAKAEPVSIYNAAATAATLDLPLNNNLGFAWIVPYGNAAQFQMGWRGYVQLAQRTGQYSKINVVEVHKNQFKSWNALTETLDADFTIDGAGDVVGYCAYFELINGFTKIVYWSIEKVKAHAKRYSKSHSNGPWKDEFDKMARKTVLKSMLSQWGILSIEMQKALVVDQAIIKDDEANEVEYVDATEIRGELEPKITHEDLQALFDLKYDAIEAKKIEEYRRILNGKEEKSYKKVHTELSAL